MEPLTKEAYDALFALIRELNKDWQPKFSEAPGPSYYHPNPTELTPEDQQFIQQSLRQIFPDDPAPVGHA